MDSTTKAVNTVTIVLNIDCPVGCRHCSVGVKKGNSMFKHIKQNAQSIIDSIQSAKKNGYSLVTFTGGEPTIQKELLKAGIEECRKNGILSSITTAPYWASNLDEAKRYAADFQGLDYAILSMDIYHLEMINIKKYEYALEAFTAQGTKVAFNLCYSDEKELMELNQMLSHLKTKITSIESQQVIPIGNAMNILNKVKISGKSIESESDIDSLKRSCKVGNLVIGLNKDVYACCWASAVAESPLKINVVNGNIDNAIHESLSARYISGFRKNGFIPMLGRQAKSDIVQQLKGKSFVNECHLCMYLMKNENRKIWDNLLV